MACGKKMEIHDYFEKFIKEKYYEMESEALSFEDFYQLSEQFFPYRGLPVLFRDILYNLIGYFYSTGDDVETTLEFYQRMIKDNSKYIKNKE